MDAKILYRHPDKNVRALPAKPLEFPNKQTEDTDTYFPEQVGEKIIYTLPVKYAKRLLANQPERYFLIEPAVLAVKVMSTGGLTHKHIEVRANPELLAKFFKEDDSAKLTADEAAKKEAEAKAAKDAEKASKAAADAAAKKKAEDDAAALAELENAPLTSAPGGRPPEL